MRFQAPLLLAVFVLLCVCASAAENGGYDDALRTRLIYFVKATRCSSNLKDWNCGATCVMASKNFSVSLVEAAGDAFVYTGVDHEHQQLVLTFRGEEDSGVWIKSLKFTTESCENGAKCKVNKQFRLLYDKVRLQVRDDVARLSRLYPQYPWVFVGYSLGGALTTLAVTDLACYLPAVATTSAPLSNVLAGSTSPGECGKLSARVYTYHSPRVGNAAYVQWVVAHMVSPLLRVVENTDPISHLPPRASDYLHTPYEVWVFDSGTFRLCNGTTKKESNKCSNSVLPLDTYYHEWHSNTRMQTCLNPFVNKATFSIPASFKADIVWEATKNVLNVN